LRGGGRHDHGGETGAWRRISGLLSFGHSHDHHGDVDDALESNEEGIRALKLSLVVLAATAAFQVGIVALSGSVALLADTIHNFGDALTALPLWLAFALARRPANRTYTYGYGRAEDLAGAAIVGIIFFSACVAGYQSVMKLIHGSEVSNVAWVAVAAVVGFLGNEVVARIRVRTGEKIGSAALVADGQHARVDGFTSLAVLLGAGGIALGYPILDPLVGLGITVAILFIVRDSALQIWRRMMDAVEPRVVEAIEQAADGIPGVEAVESVRTRWIGHRLYSEVRVRVPGAMTVAESRAVSERVSGAARRTNPKLDRVTVEITPSPG